jgi:hypothetical protein
MNRVRTLGTLLLSTAILLASPRPAKALDPTKDKILYVVCDAHLDTEFDCTILNTINSFIPATLHTNFNFFAKYPDYTFSFEGAFHYALAKEYYPADFVTLSNYVAQGRWHVAGTAWDAGDVNIPSPESLMVSVIFTNTTWPCRRTPPRSLCRILPTSAFSPCRWLPMPLPKPRPAADRWPQIR